jgi:hypothetical protein
LIQDEVPGNDPELADQIIAALNLLIKYPRIKDDITKLIENRVEVSSATKDHPTMQVTQENGRILLGPLGLLNALCGTIEDGPKKGWGFIAATFVDGILMCFERTDKVF